MGTPSAPDAIAGGSAIGVKPLAGQKMKGFQANRELSGGRFFVAISRRAA
jgi:hypothetical protein